MHSEIAPNGKPLFELIVFLFEDKRINYSYPRNTISFPEIKNYNLEIKATFKILNIYLFIFQLLSLHLSVQHIFQLLSFLVHTLWKIGVNSDQNDDKTGNLLAQPIKLIKLQFFKIFPFLT